MTFNVKLPVAFVCLLFLLGTVWSKDRNWRRDPGDKDDGGGRQPEAHDEGKRQPIVQPPPPPPYRDEPSRRVMSSLEEFMTINVPLVRTSVNVDPVDDVQIAAIWLDTTGDTVFRYEPRKEKYGPVYTPWQNKPSYPCGPIYTGSENYLVCRIKSQKFGSADYTHSEESLREMILNNKFLKGYAQMQKTNINRILMYSRLHPCGPCGQHLVDICRILKQEAGLPQGFQCKVAYAQPFKIDKDPQVREEMEKTGEVTVQQISYIP